MVQSTDTLIGVYPSDTIDVTGGINTVHERHFVLKGDTMAFGFLLPIDSFRVIGYTGLLPAMIFTCTTATSNCTTYPDNTNRLRFCLALSHYQTILSSPNWPGYDSIVVDGLAFLTVPFLGSQQIAVSIPVYYRISEWYCNPIAVDSRAAHGLVLSPNPASRAFSLDFSGELGLSRVMITNVLGEQVFQQDVKTSAGNAERLTIDIETWQAGAYSVILQTTEGQVVRKLMKMD